MYHGSQMFSLQLVHCPQVAALCDCQLSSEGTLHCCCSLGASSFTDFLGPIHVSGKNPLIKLSPTNHFTYSCYNPNWCNHRSSMLVLDRTSLQQRVTSSTRSQRPSWSKGPPSQAFCPFMSAFDPQLPRKDPDLPSGTSCTCLRHTHTHIPSQPKKGNGIQAGSLFLFSLSVMNNSLQHHALQHASLPYPLLSPRVCSN